MKSQARIVRLNSPTGSKADHIYDPGGFFRELQILDEKEKILYRSGPHHPEGNIIITFENKTYLSLSGYNQDVYIKL